jgi:hypothetical protein
MASPLRAVAIACIGFGLASALVINSAESGSDEEAHERPLIKIFGDVLSHHRNAQGGSPLSAIFGDVLSEINKAVNQDSKDDKPHSAGSIFSDALSDLNKVLNPEAQDEQTHKAGFEYGFAWEGPWMNNMSVVTDSACTRDGKSGKKLSCGYNFGDQMTGFMYGGMNKTAQAGDMLHVDFTAKLFGLPFGLQAIVPPHGIHMKFDCQICGAPCDMGWTMLPKSVKPEFILSMITPLLAGPAKELMESARTPFSDGYKNISNQEMIVPMPDCPYTVNMDWNQNLTGQLANGTVLRQFPKWVQNFVSKIRIEVESTQRAYSPSGETLANLSARVAVGKRIQPQCF